ncbi:MAG: DNA polymerase III subunit gamma/tau [Bacilli bacterium]|jgi:DNA polymerase-3 subunit gamma/tau|nr:DNA polymerase III subunit gamma/tau [Bacilli bacterium]
MDYKVLYRKYRPDDFSSIIGQDYMTSILRNSIKNSKISHAYIFSGPRGTGKTSTAKVFAKAINCLNPTDNGPCNNCDSCNHFKENADIIEIDAASNNGVEEIREIINNIKLAPAYSKYKVYIIDEVHMLSTSAFNALLLTLEEPPKHIVFILATTNIEAVPITILSRCQRFDFHKITIDNIIRRLSYVVQEENIKITQEALEEIAYISDGGLRDALSILDQLSSQSSEITIEEVISHFGSISKKQINNLFKTILENDIDTFDNLIKNFKELAIDYKLFIKKMLEKIEELAISIKKDNINEGLSYKELKEMAFELADISNYININIDPYLLIEITLLKYMKNATSQNSISNVESKAEVENISPVIEKPVPKPLEAVEEKDISSLIKIRINNCLALASKDRLQDLKAKWPQFIRNLDNKSLMNLLIDTNIAAASDSIAILTNNLDGSVNLINKELENIKNTFKKLFDLNYKFIAITDKKWQEEKLIYINNLKNKVPYVLMDEPTEEVKEEPEINNIEKTALEIFDKDKIEIE